MSATEYLVCHGLLREFARFRPLTDSGPLRRGAQVVIRTARGLELGEVLRNGSLSAPLAGDLVRPASGADLEQARHNRQRTHILLQRGTELIGSLGLPMQLLDGEILLEGQQAELHHVRWARTDPRELVRTLSREFALTLHLTDLSAPEVEDHGCGSCGSGGGCGTGCGSCGAASPEELKGYFAGLREQMEGKIQPSTRRVGLL